jgi:hypothetical protein
MVRLRDDLLRAERRRSRRADKRRRSRSRLKLQEEGRRAVSGDLNPSSMACTAAWVRSEAPNLRIIRSTCTLAAPMLMVRVCAICWLVCPVVSSSRTSVSRGVSASSRGSWCSGGVGYGVCCFSSASCLRSRVASSWFSGDSPSSTADGLDRCRVFRQQVSDYRQ